MTLIIVLAACGDREPDNSSRTAPPASTTSSMGEEPQATLNRSTVRVVFLGTSLTAGYGLEDPLVDSWPGQVQVLARDAGLPVEAVNAGVSGETSAGGLRRMDWVLRDPVDILVVELGANDALRGQDPEALRSNLNEIFRMTRERHPAAFLVLAQMEAPPNLGIPYTTAFREVFPTVAGASGATLMPFILEEVAGAPELNQSDGIHPTPAGHLIMARTAWETLGPIFEEVARALRK